MVLQAFVDHQGRFADYNSKSPGQQNIQKFGTLWQAESRISPPDHQSSFWKNSLNSGKIPLNFAGIKIQWKLSKVFRTWLSVIDP